jgi:hypothetical protein
MARDEDQPWDGTERRCGRDRRKKDRWILEDDQPVISNRRVSPRSGETSPPKKGAVEYFKTQLRRMRGTVS